MKANDLSDTRQIIDLLLKHKLQRKDMVALLILIRESISRSSATMLLDITHCVAHTTRDRGYAYEYIMSYNQAVIDFALKGGSLEGKVMFPIDEIIRQLVYTLDNIGIQNASLIRSGTHKEYIKSLLIDILDGISIAMEHAHIISSSFEKFEHNGVSHMSVGTRFKGLGDALWFKIHPTSSIGFPVFEHW